MSLTATGIRRAILEGDIDKALKHTNAFYPQVLKENEHVFFRLKCRKFIEMIRREAEINLVGGDKRSHNNGNSRVPPTDEDMELDEDVDDLDGQLESSGGTGDLTQVALLYGQSLQAEYAGDERREVRTALEEIFSLVAYQNPLKEAKVAHLLERKGRVAVAEELNSAILRESYRSWPRIPLDSTEGWLILENRVTRQVLTRSSRERLRPDQRSP